MEELGVAPTLSQLVKRVCTFTLVGSSREMPCSSDDGWWSQSQQAYCEAASPQPPLSDPVWGGRTEGQIYECTRPGAAFGVVAPVFLIWLAQPPAGAPPDPRVLAQQAVATMNLKAVSIGIVPEPAPGRVGLVGMPVWMWDTNPGPSTWGPITKTASAGGYTVTATAKATKVVWSMGDGEVVVCRTPGTPYEDSVRPSGQPGLRVHLHPPGRVPGVGPVVLVRAVVRPGPERVHPVAVRQLRAHHRG